METGLLLGFLFRGNRRFESSTSLECRNRGGRNLQRFAGLWILAGTGSALRCLEGAEANLDRIIANAEGAPAAASDPELEAAVTAAEATWVKPRTRENSKQAEVIRMLQRPEGATIGQICTATGWQAHTVRGTFAGAFKKKLGLNIVSDKPKGGERIYRIA